MRSLPTREAHTSLCTSSHGASAPDISLELWLTDLHGNSYHRQLLETVANSHNYSKLMLLSSCRRLGRLQPYIIQTPGCRPPGPDTASSFIVSLSLFTFYLNRLPLSPLHPIPLVGPMMKVQIPIAASRLGMPRVARPPPRNHTGNRVVVCTHWRIA